MEKNKGPHEKSSFQLIPREGEFVEQNCENDNSKETVAAINRRQYEILKYFGYNNSRNSELDKVLYSKAIFLYHNKLRYALSKMNATKGKEILKLLVSDRQTLFKDTDGEYQNQCVNKDFIARKRVAYREKDMEMIKKICIWSTTDDMCRSLIPINCKTRGLSEEDISQAAKQESDLVHLMDVLLSEVISDSKRRKISTQKWLYCKRHVSITSENISHFEELYGQPLITKKAREGAIEQLIGSEQNQDFRALDVPACMEDLNVLLPEAEDRTFWNGEFCELFIKFVLKKYFVIRREFLEYSTKPNKYYFDAAGFRKRFKRICELEEKANHEIKAKINLENLHLYGLRTYEQNQLQESDLMNLQRIEEAIRQFFSSLDLKLTDPPTPKEGFTNGVLPLQQRIYWAYKYETADFDLNLFHPAFFLYMTLRCKRSIMNSNDIEVRENLPMKTELKNCRKARRRVSQLQLLAKLCDIYQLDQNQRLENYEEFISWQGSKIESDEETSFWQMQLNEDEYTKLPKIGFQLYFFQLCQECVPLNLETLSYTIAYKLYRVGYPNFWKRNSAAIIQQAKEIQWSNREVKQCLKGYIKIMGNPTLSPKDKVEGIEQLKMNSPIIMEGADKLINSDRNDRSNDEMKRLMFETKLRIILQKELQEELLAAFHTLYQ